MTAHRTSTAKPAPREAAANAEPATRVLRQFRIVFNAVRSHFRQVEKHAGIGGAQLWALGLIGAKPGIGVTDLARAMDVHQSTASNLVRSLAEQNLIVAEKNGVDRRTVALKVLAKGARVLKKAPGPFSGVLPQALAGLDASTLSRMDGDLSTLIAALHADEGAGEIPLGEL